LFGHGGDADGYLSHFGYSRDSGRGYFVVINIFRHPPLREMRAALDDWVTAPLPEVQIAAGEIDPDVARALTGHYRQFTTRFPGSPPASPIEVEWVDGVLRTVLRTRTDNTIRELVPVTGMLFRRPWETRPTAVFASGPDGRVYMIGNFGNFVRQDESEAGQTSHGPALPGS
jgi:hypothetical protein